LSADLASLRSEPRSSLAYIGSSCLNHCMQNHIVIGNGNLGQDLKLELEKRGHRVLLVSNSTGFNWPRHSFNEQVERRYGLKKSLTTAVWCAVGSGSVERAEINYEYALQMNVMLPLHLMDVLNEDTRLILFTSDYAMTSVDHIRSLYALSKKHMEDMVHLSRRGNTRMYRVGSLYGNHKPVETFPGKVMSNARKLNHGQRLNVPMNPCHPTPTDWLAKQLVDHQDRIWMGSAVCDVFPRGLPMLADWAGDVIGHHLVQLVDKDPKRPSDYPYSLNNTRGPEDFGGGNVNPDGWQHLWLDRAEEFKKSAQSFLIEK